MMRGLDWLCDGSRFERGESRVHCDAVYNSGYHQVGHCWWVFLHAYLLKVREAKKPKRNSKVHEVGDFK